ncbi:MAG: condensation domain-containing protein, partial [Gammaproteobacteria bacterium]|nr:condensation domain-containing protein [Gammaproteobacteria bacterium]
CTLIKTAGSGACLLFTVHHLIFDGWSRDVFFRELAAVYRALQAGESQVLPRSVDTAATVVAPADLDADLLWWREHLQGAPRLALPFAGTGGKGAGRVPVQADPLLCRALHRLAHSEDASLFMVLAAAWAITAGALGREDDVVFGTDMAGRDRDSGDQIGFFINPLPLRITVRSGMTVREVVAGTREVVLGAFKRQHVPFDDILRATGVARDAVAAPLFDTKLVLQQGALDPPRLDGQALVPQAHIRGLDMNLLLDLTEAGGALSGWVKFRRQALDQATAGRIASAFVALLEDMVRWPEARVPDLALAISERVLPAATGFRAHAGRRQATVPSSPGVVTDALQ